MASDGLDGMESREMPDGLARMESPRNRIGHFGKSDWLRGLPVKWHLKMEVVETGPLVTFRLNWIQPKFSRIRLSR